MSDPLPTPSHSTSIPSHMDGEHGAAGWLHRVARALGLSNGENVKDQLERVLNSGETGMGFSEPEMHMLRNLMGFLEVRVDDVMVPRANILAIEENAPLADLVRLFSEAGHSRLPVYRGSLDESIGMIHIKDLMRWITAQTGLLPSAAGENVAVLNTLDLRNIDLSRSIASLGIMRKVLMAAPPEPALRLLRRMQSERVHMALVVDEFGATDGLVTIEDLIEEVFGEIEDEHDVAPEAVRKLEDGSFIADARIPLERLSEGLGAQLAVPDEDAESLGGLILWMFGRLPSPGEHVGHPAGFEFEVMSVDQHRIGKVRIRRAAEAGRELKDGARKSDSRAA